MSVSKSKTNLIVALNPTFCPKCHVPSDVVSADGKRIVLRHGTSTKIVLDVCENTGKLWSVPQSTISVSEI